MFSVHRRLGMTIAASDGRRIALRMAHCAVAACAVVILWECVIRRPDGLPPFRRVAFRAIIVSAFVHGWRCMATATNVFQAGQTFGAVTFRAI